MFNIEILAGATVTIFLITSESYPSRKNLGLSYIVRVSIFDVTLWKSWNEMV